MNIKWIYILLMTGILLFCSSKGSNVEKRVINIVPEPVGIIETSGFFTLKNGAPLVIRSVENNAPIVTYIREYFQKRLGVSVKLRQKANGAVIFTLAKIDSVGKEGYRLTVDKNNILVEANSTTGWVYALQTLYQLAPIDNAGQSSKVQIPAVRIVDYPRFEWRGNMLDVSRHFFDVDYIKKYLDMMTLYKLNKFHWHLTDDHGWRIEIKQYPKLTEIGSWRPARDYYNTPWMKIESTKEDELTPCGGFYTQEQIKEIIEYAAIRGIEIIPEIEIPGHSSEVLASYPELACDNYHYLVAVGPYWPPKAILCGGNNEVLRFLNNVLGEYAGLFPSQYIHIGGDEADYGNWKACPKCQKRIREHHLKDEAALQGWIINEVQKMATAYGKKIIGWDEILDGNVTPDAAVMYWRNYVPVSHIAGFARKGHDIIMTPIDHCYFDYRQTEDETEWGAVWSDLRVTLQKVYDFEPMIAELDGTPDAARIKGGQANLWSELLFDTERVEYMLLPRLLALSESVWSPKTSKNWERFQQKLPEQKSRLHELGYNYCDKTAEKQPEKNN